MSLKPVLIWVSVVLAMGCGLGPREPSHVAQGRYFSTGNPRYDEFFVRLHRMQVELKDAPDDLAALNAELARSVALPPTADATTLRATLAKKAGEATVRGATLRVDRARGPDGRTRLSVRGSPAQKDRALVKTLDVVLARLTDVRERTGQWRKELEWLPATGATLDGGVEAAFVGQSRAKRDDIHENLADAQKVIALMAARLRDVETRRGELEELVASALGETESEQPPPASAEPPSAKPPVPTRHRPPTAASRSQAASGGEGPPSPRPKQPTAKPDFEP